MFSYTQVWSSKEIVQKFFQRKFQKNKKKLNNELAFINDQPKNDLYKKYSSYLAKHR